MTYQLRTGDESVLICPGAAVTGDVSLGKGVSIWYNAVLRGDEGTITVGEDTNGATVTPLLTTSDASYSKLAGYELDTYDKEEGDLDGPFTLAVSVEAGSGQMVWFSSSAFLDDKYNALSSGANVNLGMNALSSLVGESEAMAIRSKSLNYNYLTISESTSSLLKVLMIGIVPLAYLGVGIAVVVKRRRMQNEAV